MVVDLFCRVVDNFGDIGVVWRLTKGLAALRPDWTVRLTVDNLSAFSHLCPEVSPSQESQQVDGIRILSWTAESNLYQNPAPQVVIENFGGGWPEKFGTLLFDPRPEPRLIVNVDYLSAEDYPGEIHRLPSLTPLSQVKKFFFMPGFSADTGGLMLGPPPLPPALRSPARSKFLQDYGAFLKGTRGLPTPEDFWVSVFTYEHNFTPLVEDLVRWGRTPTVFICAGRSAPSFLRAWTEAGEPFPLIALPFLPQESYDHLVDLCDLNLVRGEESLVRGAVSGRPFLWHAYLQEEGYQRVKVEALLQRLLTHFPEAQGLYVADLFQRFNHRTVDQDDLSSDERFYPFFKALPDLQEGFRLFAESLRSQGDFIQHLVDFLEENAPG